MGLQVITGYPSSWRAPFVAMELLLGQGPSSAGAGPREACYCGPMTSAGTWTANTLYQVFSEQDAINGAGAGSPLHRMIRMHLKANPNGRVYAVPYAASSGGSPVAATGTITWATTPTASGQTRVTVCGEQVSATFTTSSTVTTIAADIRDKINAKVWLPVTATAAAGVLTLTAKIAGASQGDGTVGVIRFRADIDAGKGTTVATSGAALGLGTGVAGADGTTTENANLTSALAAVVASRLYYMGFSVWDTTNLTTIKTHVVNKNAPSPGLNTRAFTGYTSTLSAGLTVANNKNTEYMHIAWQKNSEHDTAELAAGLMAITQLKEQLDSAYPGFDAYSSDGWLILPAYAVADWPTEQDKNDAVTGGLCCIASNTVKSFLVMHVTTRSKDSTGTINDFRATESHRVSVMHDMRDTILLNHYLQFTAKGFKLQDDLYLPDGTVDTNSVLTLATDVMTPSRYKPWFFDQLRQFTQGRARIQRLADWLASTRVNIDPQNSSRLEVGSSGRVIDLFHQASFRISETSPG